MKNQFLMLCLSGLAAAGCSSVDRQAATACFSARLAGEEAVYEVSAPISAGDVDALGRQVWQLWCDANAAFVEEKLPELLPLAEEHADRWSIPASLEPDAVMPFYWGAKGERPEAGYPLFLYMHGSGPKAREWSNGIRLGNAFDDAPSIYFIPQIPNEGEWYRWYQRGKQWAWERLLRLAFVSGDVDPNRVYFFGISEGAYGSQRLASFYADYLAGAGPIAGGEPLQNAPAENCANIAFSLRTGTEDPGWGRNVLTACTGEAFDRLAAAHPGYYEHWVEMPEGATHTSIDYRPTTPWLAQHVRNPYPHYVYWENFEMDGRCREGFYNLWLVEPPTTEPGVRSTFEMTIEGNAIRLDVGTMAYEVTATVPDWGVPMTYDRKRSVAHDGRLIVYLCDELVDLGQEVTLTVNGREAFRGVPQLDAKHLVNSCAAFGDPRRLYPAAIEVDLAAL